MLDRLFFFRSWNPMLGGACFEGLISDSPTEKEVMEWLV